jgi:hypothetical protein
MQEYCTAVSKFKLVHNLNNKVLHLIYLQNLIIIKY